MKAYSLSEALSRREQVTELVLKMDDLAETFPEGVGLLPGLRKLTVTGGRFGCLPEVLARLPLLEVLCFRNCGLRETGPVLERLRRLSGLDLRSNSLSVWPAGLSCLTSLQSLDLGDNQLRSIPPGIGRLGGLRILQLEDNRISRLSEKVGNCQDLQRLDLSRNRLRQLPVAVGRLSGLRQLLLAGNRLVSLPRELVECRYLQRLDLEANRFRQIPDALRRMTWLTQLRLGRNDLSEVPAWLPELARLEQLSLAGNDLQELPALSELGWLRELQLGDNALALLGGLPPRLRVLNLSGNRFRGLPAAVTRLEDLVELDLSGNPVSSLDHLSRLKSLQRLYAYRTPVQLEAGSLLDFPDLQEVRGLLPPSTTRQLLDFWNLFPTDERPPAPRLRHCYRIFRKDRSVWEELSLEELCALLSVGQIAIIQPVWRYLHRQYGARGRSALRRGRVMACSGRLASPEGSLPSRLEALGVEWQEWPDDRTTHFLLGEEPDCGRIPSQSLAIMDEAGVAFWLDRAEGRYLAGENDPEKINNLRRLLLHEDERNAQLGIRMIAGGGLPRALLTDLVLARCRVAQPEAVDRLLWPYLSVAARARLQSGGDLVRVLWGREKPATREVIGEAVRKIAEGTELDEAYLAACLADRFR